MPIRNRIGGSLATPKRALPKKTAAVSCRKCVIPSQTTLNAWFSAFL